MSFEDHLNICLCVFPQWKLRLTTCSQVLHLDKRAFYDAWLRPTWQGYMALKHCMFFTISYLFLATDEGWDYHARLIPHYVFARLQLQSVIWLYLQGINIWMKSTCLNSAGLADCPALGFINWLWLLTLRFSLVMRLNLWKYKKDLCLFVCLFVFFFLFFLTVYPVSSALEQRATRNFPHALLTA